jgi:hypothetical protein
MKSLFILSMLLICAFVPPDRKITSTRQLLETMYARYAGKWVRSLTFVQHNTHYEADTVASKTTWYEAIEYPDKFRIDFGDPAEGNAVIFARDSVFQLKSGRLQASRRQPNNLLLLSGGIYFMSVDEALQRLQDEGFDVSRFREDTWQGRPVYVVGAAKGDETRAQFWLDRQHLYLVRTLTPTADGKVQEAQFGKHQKTGGGWTETQVLFLTDGKKRQLEDYTQLTVNPALDPALFDATRFGQTHWRK